MQLKLIKITSDDGSSEEETWSDIDYFAADAVADGKNDLNDDEICEYLLDEAFHDGAAPEVDCEINEFEESEFLIATELGANLHLRCFEHSLQCCLRSSVDSDLEFACFKKKVLNLLNRFFHSNRAQQLLIERTGLNLIKPCSTRWNYFFDVLHRLLQLKSTVNSICEELKFDSLSNSDWEKVNFFLKK